MFNLGMGEITVILLLILIFVGPKKLPDLAAGLGKAIRQIRKTTADVKNEIVLDDTFRKPFEELRDAVTLPPEELKRRDNLMAEVRRQVEEVGRAIHAPPPMDGPATPPPEPIAGGGPGSAAPAAPIAAETSAPWPPPLAPAPAAAPPASPLFGPPTAPPVGTFPRSPTPAPLQPGRLGGPQRVTPPISSLNSNRANITQALSEEDLLPATKGAPPPPPPPLPGIPPPPPGTKKG